jgi:hypothetical protein
MGKICFTNKSLQFSEIAHKSLGKSIPPSSPSVPLLFGFLFLSRAGTSLSFSLSFFLSSNQSSTGRPLAARTRLDRRLQAWRGPVSGVRAGRRAARAQGGGSGLERAARCEASAGGSARGRAVAAARVERRRQGRRWRGMLVACVCGERVRQALKRAKWSAAQRRSGSELVRRLGRSRARGSGAGTGAGGAGAGLEQTWRERELAARPQAASARRQVAVQMRVSRRSSAHGSGGARSGRSTGACRCGS